MSGELHLGWNERVIGIDVVKAYSDEELLTIAAVFGYCVSDAPSKLMLWDPNNRRYVCGSEAWDNLKKIPEVEL